VQKQITFTQNHLGSRDTFLAEFTWI